MTYQQVRDFQRGLDTRRSVFAAPPGTLRRCRNGHITRGGEVAKRKAFALNAELPPDTFGLHAVRDELYVFGSEAAPAELPGAVRYQRLQAPSGALMRRVLATQNFGGRIYAIAAYANGAVHHFFDGARVTDWDTIAESIADADAVAQALAGEVRAETRLTTAVRDRRLTISGTVPGEAFFAAVSVEDTAVATLTLTTVQAAEAPLEQLAATAALRIEPPGGVTSDDQVTAVRVDGGANLLGSEAPIHWRGTVEVLGEDIAEAINATDTPYSATASDGTVTVTAALDDGAQANGRQVSAEVSANLDVALAEAFAGGQDADPGAVQIIEVEVGADFDADATYRLEVKDADIPVLGRAAGVGRTVLTFGDKLYSVAQSILYFSGFVDGEPDATAWVDTVTGAGFIDMSTQESGADRLTALGIYQDQLAVFARASVQMWRMDPDPVLNQHVQTLQNIGTLGAGSVLAFGDLDLFFLAESGIRSLRARDSSNRAGVEDVGTPVDDDVVAFLLGEPENARRHAVAALEPTSGRYWLAIGAQIYVFSRFPGSGIAAWSTYTLDDAEAVDALAVTTAQAYARAGDRVYLYGGVTRAAYSDVETEVWLPFLDGDDPGTTKTLQSIGVGCTGTWQVYLHPDPARPEYSEHLGYVDATTYGLNVQFPALGQSTHFSLRFVSTTAEPARLASVLLFYAAGARR